MLDAPSLATPLTPGAVASQSSADVYMHELEGIMAMWEKSQEELRALKQDRKARRAERKAMKAELAILREQTADDELRIAELSARPMQSQVSAAGKVVSRWAQKRESRAGAIDKATSMAAMKFLKGGLRARAKAAAKAKLKAAALAEANVVAVAEAKAGAISQAKAKGIAMAQSKAAAKSGKAKGKAKGRGKGKGKGKNLDREQRKRRPNAFDNLEERSSKHAAAASAATAAVGDDDDEHDDGDAADGPRNAALSRARREENENESLMRAAEMAAAKKASEHERRALETGHKEAAAREAIHAEATAKHEAELVAKHEAELSALRAELKSQIESSGAHDAELRAKLAEEHAAREEAVKERHDVTVEMQRVDAAAAAEVHAREAADAKAAVAAHAADVLRERAEAEAQAASAKAAKVAAQQRRRPRSDGNGNGAAGDVRRSSPPRRSEALLRTPTGYHRQHASAMYEEEEDLGQGVHIADRRGGEQHGQAYEYANARTPLPHLSPSSSPRSPTMGSGGTAHGEQPLSEAALELLHGFATEHMLHVPPSAIGSLVRRITVAWNRSFRERHAALKVRHEQEIEVLRRRASQTEPYREVMLREQVDHLARVVEEKEGELGRVTKQLERLQLQHHPVRAIVDHAFVAQQRRLIERLGAELAQIGEENVRLRNLLLRRRNANPNAAPAAAPALAPVLVGAVAATMKTKS